MRKEEVESQDVYVETNNGSRGGEFNNNGSTALFCRSPKEAWFQELR